MSLRKNKQGILGYRKQPNEGGVMMNNRDDTSGARLLYRYREENVALATKLKDIKSFIQTFDSTQKFEQKELYGLASSMASYLDNANWNFKLLNDSIVSKEKLDQIFMRISNDSHRITELLNQILGSIDKENQALSEFIKSKRNFIEVSQEVDKVISNFLHEQDILKTELGTLLPNLSQLVDQTDLIETQEVETLGINYITFYYELERLLKEPNSSKDEIFIALHKICFFLRNFIGSLESLGTANEDLFLHELGIHKDEKNVKLKEHFEKRGITRDAITHPRIFAQNFFRAARGESITKSFQNVADKEESDKNEVAQKVLKKLCYKIGKLEEEVNTKYKEKVDTSKIEEDYWDKIGVSFNQQIVSLNGNIKNQLGGISSLPIPVDKAKLNYLELLFNLPNSNFDSDLKNFRDSVVNSLPQLNYQQFSIEPKLLLNPNGNNLSTSDHQEIETKLTQLSEEEKKLYEELEWIHSALNARAQENQKLMEMLSQLSLKAKTTSKDKKGNMFIEEFPNMKEAMASLYDRMNKVYFEFQDYEQKRSQKHDEIRKIREQLVAAKSEVEKMIVRTTIISIVYEIEQVIINMKLYYNQHIASNYVENILKKLDKKSNNQSQKEMWSKLNKGFSGCFESFSF